MKYEEFYEERILSDVAKGRFPKAKVKEIFHTLCRVVAKNVEKAVFEYCWLFCAEKGHFPFDFITEKPDKSRMLLKYGDIVFLQCSDPISTKHRYR